MSEINGGIITFLVVAAAFHVGQFYVCNSTLPTTNNDPPSTFETFQAYASFSACDGNAVFQWVLFFLFTFIVLLIIASFLFVLFNNAVTGTILGAIVMIGGLVLIFS